MEYYDNFDEDYCGEWASEEDFAHNIIEDCYDIEMSNPHNVAPQTTQKKKVNYLLIIDFFKVVPPGIVI